MHLSARTKWNRDRLAFGRFQLDAIGVCVLNYHCDIPILNSLSHEVKILRWARNPQDGRDECTPLAELIGFA
jgi:hypothetical protein